MNTTLFIDLGHYSIKFLEVMLEKKSMEIIHLEKRSVSDYLMRGDDPRPVDDLQMAIVEQYLEEKKFKGEVVLLLPSKYLTHRFYSLPVKNTKKANLMIPFQLDKDLIFPLKQAHYCTKFIKEKNSIFASIHITTQELFNQFHHRMEKLKIPVSKVTGRVSILEQYIAKQELDGHFALLDLGHRSTNFYFIWQKKVLATLTFAGIGQQLFEAFEKTYQLNIAQVEELLEKRFPLQSTKKNEQISKKEQEYFNLFNEILGPLKDQLQQAILSLQIQFGMTIQKLYLTGGNAQLSNMDSFLHEKLSISTGQLSLLGNPKVQDRLSSQQLMDNYFLLLAADIHLSKFPAANFLHGRYAKEGEEEIPIFSAGLLLARSMTVCLVIIFTFLIEKVYITQKEKSINIKFHKDHLPKPTGNIKIEKILKNKNLGINSRDRSKVVKFPEIILKKVVESQLVMEEQIEELSHRGDDNALLPLLNLGRSLPLSQDVSLIRYTSDSKNHEIIFHSLISKNLDVLAEKIQSLHLNNLKVEEKSDKKLHLSFQDL